MLLWIILVSAGLLSGYFFIGRGNDPTKKFARQVTAKKLRLAERSSAKEALQQAAEFVDLRPFDADNDVELLDGWLHQEHVQRWWGDPRDAISDAHRRPSENHRVITFKGLDCGYVCWEAPDSEELAAAGLTQYAPGLIDVDILIGRLDLLGCGIGTTVGKRLLDEISGPGIRVGVGMSSKNKRAIRTAKSLGFRTVHTFEDPETGPCHYMLLEN